MILAKDMKPGEWYTIRQGDLFHVESGKTIVNDLSFTAYATDTTEIDDDGHTRRLFTKCAHPDFDEFWVRIDEVTE